MIGNIKKFSLLSIFNSTTIGDVFRDGGDCCGDEVDTNYCVDCDCKDPAFAGLAKLTGSGENTISNFTNVHNQFQKYYEQKRLYLQSEGELPENQE